MEQINVMEGYTDQTHPREQADLHTELEEFCEFGKETAVRDFALPEYDILVYVNEFWTSKQRAAHSLHEISYRACFKPQLPRFFISRLTQRGDVVYDPFMGRGTTLLETALLGRVPFGCDINPLSRILVSPRFDPPDIDEIGARLESLNLEQDCETWDELLVFYHPETLKAITNLRNCLLQKEADGSLDEVDAWIRMVATNRLTGHSPGFFSVYTLPPNQAVSIARQTKINADRQQMPPMRDIRPLILKKSKSLQKQLQLQEVDLLRDVASEALLLTESCQRTPEISDRSVDLVVLLERIVIPLTQKRPQHLTRSGLLMAAKVEALGKDLRLGHASHLHWDGMTAQGGGEQDCKGRIAGRQGNYHLVGLHGCEKQVNVVASRGIGPQRRLHELQFAIQFLSQHQLDYTLRRLPSFFVIIQESALAYGRVSIHLCSKTRLLQRVLKPRERPGVFIRRRDKNIVLDVLHHVVGQLPVIACFCFQPVDLLS